jgi:predicted negative regulator of RcsB-dependent stress response
VARITRKELKTDKFAVEVEQTFTFFEEHRKEIVQYGVIAAVVIAIALGVLFYQRHQHASRQNDLAKAIQIQESPTGSSAPPNSLSFPTPEAKEEAALKAFGELQSKYPGSPEGEIAGYYLGSINADQGKLVEAEKKFLEVSQKGDARYASLAKLSLAQIYFADGHASQGEQILRDMMAHPTIFVSKEQATVTLARALLHSNPSEARKLLDPLKTRPGNIGEVVLSLYGELPPQ